MSNLRNLVLDLIDQIEITDFEDQGGYLKNNEAYIALKNVVNERIHVGEQSFKSGIKDLVVAALDSGNNALLKNCQLTLQDDTLIKFEIEVRVREIELPETKADAEESNE